MAPLIRNAEFHHIEIPCDDLELAERFYVIVFGAEVYMRRDVSRRSEVPADGSIADAEARGFAIDATYMKIGDRIRIGFLKDPHEHAQKELDHIAFAIDEDDLTALSWRLVEISVEVVEYNANRMLIRDPFGMMLELWPNSVLKKMGLL